MFNIIVAIAVIWLIYAIWIIVTCPGCHKSTDAWIKTIDGVQFLVCTRCGYKEESEFEYID